MASTRFRASRFFSIAAFQSIAASSIRTQGAGIIARARRAWIKEFSIAGRAAA
jgi:hypothetical protein